jgi:hypothetical protein
MTVNCRHAKTENIMTLQFPNIQHVNNCELMQQEKLYLYFANTTSKFKAGLTNPSQQYSYGGKPFLEHNSLSFIDIHIQNLLQMHGLWFKF